MSDADYPLTSEEKEEELQESGKSDNLKTKQPTKKIDKRKFFKNYSKQYDSLLKYPFKSKVKYFDESIEFVQ